MTPETINAGWFILAASLLTLGAFIAWGGYEVWSERQARKAERILKSAAIARVNRAALITPAESGLDDLFAELLNESLQRRMR